MATPVGKKRRADHAAIYVKIAGTYTPYAVLAGGPVGRWLLIGAVFLWNRRKTSASLMGEFLIINGIGRFCIEFWRLNARVAFGLSEAQFIGMGLIVGGIVLIVRARSANGDAVAASA